MKIYKGCQEQDIGTGIPVRSGHPIKARQLPLAANCSHVRICYLIATSGFTCLLLTLITLPICQPTGTFVLQQRAWNSGNFFKTQRNESVIGGTVEKMRTLGPMQNSNHITVVWLPLCPAHNQPGVSLYLRKKGSKQLTLFRDSQMLIVLLINYSIVAYVHLERIIY